LRVEDVDGVLFIGKLKGCFACSVDLLNLKNPDWQKFSKFSFGFGLAGF